MPSVCFDTSVKDAVVVLSDGSFLCCFSARLVDEGFSSLFPHFFSSYTVKSLKMYGILGRSSHHSRCFCVLMLHVHTVMTESGRNSAC